MNRFFTLPLAFAAVVQVNAQQSLPQNLLGGMNMDFMSQALTGSVSDMQQALPGVNGAFRPQTVARLFAPKAQSGDNAVWRNNTYSYERIYTGKYNNINQSIENVANFKRDNEGNAVSATYSYHYKLNSNDLDGESEYFSILDLNRNECITKEVRYANEKAYNEGVPFARWDNLYDDGYGDTVKKRDYYTWTGNDWQPVWTNELIGEFDSQNRPTRYYRLQKAADGSNDYLTLDLCYEYGADGNVSKYTVRKNYQVVNEGNDTEFIRCTESVYDNIVFAQTGGSEAAKYNENYTDWLIGIGNDVSQYNSSGYVVDEYTQTGEISRSFTQYPTFVTKEGKFTVVGSGITRTTGIYDFSGNKIQHEVEKYTLTDEYGSYECDSEVYGVAYVDGQETLTGCTGTTFAKYNATNGNFESESRSYDPATGNWYLSSDLSVKNTYDENGCRVMYEYAYKAYDVDGTVTDDLTETKRYGDYRNYATTGISSAASDKIAAQRVYNINGVCLGSSLDALPNGVYVVKDAAGSRKVLK